VGDWWRVNCASICRWHHLAVADFWFWLLAFAETVRAIIPSEARGRDVRTKKERREAIEKMPFSGGRRKSKKPGSIKKE
jgi:hypothetical protein